MADPREALDTQGQGPGVGGDQADQRKLTRRQFIGLAVETAVGAVLASCVPPTPAKPTEGAANSPASPTIPTMPTEGAANSPVSPAIKPAAGPEPTPSPFPDTLGSTDSNGKYVQPTRELEQQLPALKKAALEKLRVAMVNNKQMFPRLPSDYSAIEHDILSTKGDSLVDVTYLITDTKPIKVSKTKPEDVKPQVQILDGTNIYYWERNNNTPMRIEIPEKVNTFVFDAEKNQLMMDITDKDGIACTGIISLTGENAGKLELIYSTKEGGWASYTEGEKKGMTNPEAMYPIIGSVDHRNRRLLDVGTFAKMRIAYDTGVDLTKTADHQARRGEIAGTLNGLQNRALQDSLLSIQSQSAKLHQNIKNITVVLDSKNAVGQVVVEDGDSLVRYTLEASADGSKLKELKDYALLPQLKVEGPYILRTDQVVEGEDRRIQFKGVNMTIVRPSQIDFKANIYFISTRVLIDKAFEWGANLVRFQVDIDIINDSISEFDKIIDYLETKGMYAIIVPFSFGKTSKNSFGAPIPAVTPFMGEMARRYKNHPNVMFELVNELEEQNDYNVVRQGLRDIAAAIFAQNNQAFIWLPGLRYNKRFSEIIANLNDFESPNKGIDVHNYLSLDSKGNNVTEARRDFQQAFGRVPVLIGEAGVNYDRGGQTHPDDDKYVQEAINWTEQYHNMVQIAAYCFEAAGLHSLLTTWGNPSKRGKWYYDDFKRNQHTFFYR